MEVDLGKQSSIEFLFKVLENLNTNLKIFDTINGIFLVHNNIHTFPTMPNFWSKMKLDALHISYNDVRKFYRYDFTL